MTKRQHQAIARRKLNLERLDSRQMLTGIIFDSANGEVRIEGSSTGDQVTVSIDPRTSAYDDDVLHVEMRAGSTVYTRDIPMYGVVGPEIGRVVNKISFKGYAGDDTFRNNTSLPSFASGGSGTDRLYGGISLDTLHGGGGTDYLYGGASNDFLDGGVPGVAVYSQNTGDDYLFGGSGDDTLHASDFGNGRLYGESDNDTLYGWGGNDRLSGGSGHDLLHGYTGSDRLYGGSGNDRYLFSNTSSSFETDTLVEYSGDGLDRLDFSALSSTNRLTVDLSRDALASHGSRRVVAGYTGHAGNVEIVIGGRGDDSITGNGLWNTLYGGSGNDTIRGGAGVDSLYGEAGNDELHGDSSGDHLHGGTENDTLHGGAGNDYLYGNNGNDRLYGGTEQDRLYGGADDDGLFGGVGWVDYLSGGTGDDRFLQVTGNNDTLADFAGVNDVKLVFRNGTALTDRSFSGRDPAARWNFAAGSWTDQQIEQADGTFAVVQAATGNTRLLKRANDPLGNSPMTYVMQGAGTQVAGPTDSWGIGGWNSGGDVYFVGNVSTNTIIHEIGHNWEDASEIGATRRSEWLNISGWVQSSTRPSLNHTASSGLDDNWWMRSDAAFAENYGRMNPEEDMGTTFEAYFSDSTNPAVRGDGTSITGAAGSTTADNIPLKIAFLDRLFDSLA